jgi:2-iminobutanoate/2-iminopropanoate deaminase
MDGDRRSATHVRNLKLLLEPAGSSLNRIVQVHAMIYDRIEYDVLNRAHRPYVPNAPPARRVMSVDRDRVQSHARRDRRGGSARATPADLSRQVIASPRNLGLPLSPAIRAGEFVFISSVLADDLSTGERRHNTVAAQTRQILTDMGRLLEAAGSSLVKVVKVNVPIYSMLEYDNMNLVYRDFFPTNPRPGRSVVLR